MNQVPVSANRRFLPNRLPRLCIAVSAANAGELLEKAEDITRDFNFLEFRLDYIAQPASVLPKLKQFLESHRDLTVIATCRRVAGGGKFRGSVAAQIEVLKKAAASGCHIVDLELESAQALKLAEWNKFREQAAVMLSHHDFRGTKKLDETWQAMDALAPDFIKIVSTAKSLADNVAMMRLLEKRRDERPTVGLCMGELGTVSRVLGVRAGSAFTFAAPNSGEQTAPGQITGKVLRDVYRIDRVDAATRVYAVAGNPIKQSLSPLTMNLAFRRENVNAVYLALETDDAEDLLKCVQGVPLQGLSVTMPLKQAVMEYLDNTETLAEKIGACNTIVRSQDGKIYGFNTDVAGVVRPLENRIALRGARILVLGAGGAARAAVFGLVERGAEVYVLNRDKEKGQKLARQAHAHSLSRQQLAKAEFDVIINATPVGMNGVKPQAPLNEEELRGRYIFDMVYSPMETRLIKMARAKGLHVIPGYEMFVSQGARQFEIWTGKPAPMDDMQRAVVHALNQRQENGAARP